jgi:hypothetical protein
MILSLSCRERRDDHLSRSAQRAKTRCNRALLSISPMARPALRTGSKGRPGGASGAVSLQAASTSSARNAARSWHSAVHVVASCRITLCEWVRHQVETILAGTAACAWRTANSRAFLGFSRGCDPISRRWRIRQKGRSSATIPSALKREALRQWTAGSLVVAGCGSTGPCRPILPRLSRERGVGRIRRRTRLGGLLNYLRANGVTSGDSRTHPLGRNVGQCALGLRFSRPALW